MSQTVPFKTALLRGAVIALLFSAFIYIEHYGLPQVPLLETLFALGAYYALLVCERRTVLAAGFGIGLAWFYWVGFSFEYYGLPWMQPIVIAIFASVFMLFFGVITLSRRPYVRAVLLFGLSFVEPLSFNWMVPELPLIHGCLGAEKWQFALILAALALTASIKAPWRYAGLLLLVGAYTRAPEPLPLAPFKIKLVQTTLPQELKWKPYMRHEILAENFRQIDRAIREGYDIVVLPESTFVIFMNLHPEIEAQLLLRSHDIAIVTGALYAEDDKNYNVSYFFHHGRSQMVRKMVLVPFGEYIPLPQPIAGWANDAFFNGASDYIAAEKPGDFILSTDANETVIFRSAVCYEATCEPLYLGNPAYMLAISNNAWFTPSIEPTLQKLLMQYYARRHHTVIYHSANMAGTGIVQ